MHNFADNIIGKNVQQTCNFIHCIAEFYFCPISNDCRNLAVGSKKFGFYVVVPFQRPDEIFYLQQNTGLDVSFMLN